MNSLGNDHANMFLLKRVISVNNFLIVVLFLILEVYSNTTIVQIFAEEYLNKLYQESVRAQ